MMKKKGLTYKSSGVDINKAEKLVGSIKEIAAQTRVPGVVGGIGGFGGIFSLQSAGYEQIPILVSSTDGVGTKLKIAFMTGKHDTVGIDLVAMVVNDVLAQGAKPLFFLDYLATGKLNIGVAKLVISGVAEGCKQAGCALIGGETAELPGFYSPGEYDLSGFAVGAVDGFRISWFDSFSKGWLVEEGDQLIGIASDGLHSNGYSLLRKLFFQVLKMDVRDEIPGLGVTVGEELLRPTKIYSTVCPSLLRKVAVKAFAHITGGGMIDNIPRIIPSNLAVNIWSKSWPVPPIFSFVQEYGKVDDGEMRRTFNCGIGMVAVVPDNQAKRAIKVAEEANELAYNIGQVVHKNAIPGKSRIWFS